MHKLGSVMYYHKLLLCGVDTGSHLSGMAGEAL